MYVPLIDQVRAEKLLQLAAEHFAQVLSEAELQVLTHSAGSFEPGFPSEGTPQPEVRSEFIRWLATDPVAAPLIDPRGIRVWSATIASRLDLQGCRIPHQLSFLRCKFIEDVWLITAEMPALYFLGGEIVGRVVADGINVRGPLFLRRLNAHSIISLVGSQIGRNFDCCGATLSAEGIALNLDGATIQGSVFLRDGFRSSGEIRMLNARIRGDFGCTGARIAAPDKALMLDKVIIEGLMSLGGGFEAAGTVSLSGGQVFGDLDCEGASLTTKGIALNLTTVSVGGHLFLRNGFKSSGEVSLHSARIGNSVDCSGAIFADSVTALRFEGAVVEGDVYFCHPFRSTGRVELQSAQLHGNLNCVGASLPALYCLNMKLDGDLVWAGIENPQQTHLWLNGAKVKTIRDEKISWPGAGKLHVDGLTYQELPLHEARTPNDLQNNSLGKETEFNVGDRIEWLNRQPDMDKAKPQPWMQFADLLTSKANNKGAKRVIFEMKKHQARPSWLLLRWWKILFALLEEQPLRILVPICLFAALGSSIFWAAGRVRAMAPTDKDTYLIWSRGHAFTTPYPPFNPFIYSLENGLPLVKLGQDDKWMPDPNRRATNWVNSYAFLAGTRWFLILAGWAQATILASAVGSRFKN